MRNSTLDKTDYISEVEITRQTYYIEKELWKWKFIREKYKFQVENRDHIPV